MNEQIESYLEWLDKQEEREQRQRVKERIYSPKKKKTNK